MNTKQPSNYQEEVKRVADRIDDALIASVQRMDENEDVNLDNIIIALAEARAYIVGLSIRLIAVDRLLISIPGDAPRIYADELTVGERAHQAALQSGKLPKLQKQPKRDTTGYVERPGLGKKLRKPREFACATCLAEAGTSCFYMTSQGKNAKVTDKRRPDEDDYYHATRRALSKAANVKLRAAYDREHFGDPT